MEAQPNEIIHLILSNLDNRNLMIIRRVNKRWKNLIENKIFYKNPLPSLPLCLITCDYYHFMKYYYVDDDDEDYGIYKELVKLKQDDIFLGKFPLEKPIRLVKKSWHSCTGVAINRILLWAIKYGYLKIIQFLVEKGADIHICSEDPLHLAADEGYLEIVKFLLEQGADIHASNEFALRCAAEHDHLEIIKYLLQQGANIHVALHKANVFHYEHVIKILQPYLK